jgi:hypothetical protein
MNACGSPAWQALGAQCVGLRGESLGECSPGGAEERWLHWPMGQGLACSTGYSFSKPWHGEDFHKLGVQSADDSALPGALPQPSILQSLCKVPGSRSSHGLQLGPSHHLGSSPTTSLKCQESRGRWILKDYTTGKSVFLKAVFPGQIK